MKKLKLDLDDLTVEAFETGEDLAAVGTVEGHGPTISQCGGSCWISCNGTCPHPCSGGFYSECCTGDVCTEPTNWAPECADTSLETCWAIAC